MAANTNWYHQQRVDQHRARTTKTLNAVERGHVDQEELEVLRNFCQVSLALMALVDAQTFDSAVRNAELSSRLHGDIDER